MRLKESPNTDSSFSQAHSDRLSRFLQQHFPVVQPAQLGNVSPYFVQHAIREVTLRQRKLTSAPELLISAFMSTRGPNEVQNLTVDQQQAIAECELARLHRQDRLLRQARNYPGRRWLSLVVFVLALWVAGQNAEFPYVVVVWLLALVFGLLHVHIHGINRRLDALLELLNANVAPAPKKEAAEPINNLWSQIS